VGLNDAALPFGHVALGPRDQIQRLLVHA
jgi:hypothetical protein